MLDQRDFDNKKIINKKNDKKIDRNIKKDNNDINNKKNNDNKIKLRNRKKMY